MQYVPSIKCGNCGHRHANTAGVRACYRSRYRPAPAPVVRQATMATEPVWPLRTPEPMVNNIKDGRYAVRADSNQPFVFVRVKRPKTGKKNGCLVVQTQHSDWYRDELTIYPSGRIWCPQPHQIDMPLLLVAADPMTGAMNYGMELGVCSRCGRELTDERSRWYGIGPECEHHWPEIIARVDSDNNGPWYLGKVKVG
jgi:DNA-directed RNA polymerase subunit RPC12/RpoP